MALWDILWFSLLNYTSSRNELSTLVTAPPSSAHLLKRTCSNVVAKHCTFLWMLKTWSRGITLVLLILRGWKEVFSDLDSFQQTHWSWQAFVFVVERGRVCENTSLCRIPLLLVSACDYNECARGSSFLEFPVGSWLQHLHRSVWQRAHHGLQISHYMWRPSDCSQGSLGARGTDTCNSFFFFSETPSLRILWQ